MNIVWKRSIIFIARYASRSIPHTHKKILYMIKTVEHMCDWRMYTKILMLYILHTHTHSFSYLLRASELSVSVCVNISDWIKLYNIQMFLLSPSSWKNKCTHANKQCYYRVVFYLTLIHTIHWSYIHDTSVRSV